MREALKEAAYAFEDGEVPSARSSRSSGGSSAAPTSARTPQGPHRPPEMIAITQAAEALGRWRLPAARSTSRSSRARCAPGRWSSGGSTGSYTPRRTEAGACGSLMDIVGDRGSTTRGRDGRADGGDAGAILRNSSGSARVGRGRADER